MKAIITTSGALQIERAGQWKAQFCPYSQVFCGDYCPAFDEDVPLDRQSVIACGTMLTIVNDLRKHDWD